MENGTGEHVCEESGGEEQGARYLMEEGSEPILEINREATY